MSAQVYVMFAPARGIKVGCSGRLQKRRKEVAFGIGEEVTLLHASAPLENAKQVEVMAHWLLRDHHQGGEWFSVEASAAVAAIDEAILRVGAGEAAPQRINNATPYADLKTETIQVCLPISLMERVTEWRRLQPRLPSRPEAIRMLVDRFLSEAAGD